MPAAYRTLSPAEIDTADRARRGFAFDVLIGLAEQPKRLSSRYFYDARGSELFARICDLDEYYLTRCEHAILEKHKGAILDLLDGRPFHLVDLGAGDARKTRVLLDHFTAQGADFEYVPIDISEDAMRGLVERLGAALPEVPINGVVSEYADGIAYLGQRAPDRRNLVLFLGSNIGNFDKPHARAILRRLWSALRDGDYLLVGFDLKKDIEVLLDAYNDAPGVTAAFNKNVLRRINDELGGNFDLDQFRHFATYNVFSGAMESYLVSLAEQTVYIEAIEASFTFRAWEPVHTEYSYKYLERDVEDLAALTGFTIEHRLFDDRRWFLDAIWRVRKEAPPAP